MKMKQTPYSVIIQYRGSNPMVGETTYRLSQAKRRLEFESRLPGDDRIVDIVTAQGIIIASNITNRVSS